MSSSVLPRSAGTTIPALFSFLTLSLATPVIGHAQQPKTAAKATPTEAALDRLAKQPAIAKALAALQSENEWTLTEQAATTTAPRGLTGKLTVAGYVVPAAKRSFKKVDATNAVFLDRAMFDNRDILEPSSFQNCVFLRQGVFHRSQLIQGVSFHNARFDQHLTHRNVELGNELLHLFQLAGDVGHKQLIGPWLGYGAATC
jgi:hypothetical protein